MENEKYLKNLLESYYVPVISKKDIRLKEIKSLIKNWAGKHFRKLILIGSNEKDTSILGYSELDLLVSLKSKTDKDLVDLKNSLEVKLAKNKYEIISNKDFISIKIEGLNLKIIPAIFQKGTLNYHFVVHPSNNELVSTNFNLHTNHIIDSGKNNEIKLLKIWTKCQQLKFPSNYLDLVVLKALKNNKKEKLFQSFKTVMLYLSTDFLEDEYIDLANSKIHVSDLLSKEEKLSISKKAKEFFDKKLDIDKVVW
jgi:hypothetical protein